MSAERWVLKVHYDSTHELVVAEFENVLLAAEPDVLRWRREISTRLGTFGRKVDLLIGLDGLIVRPAAATSFGRHRREVLETYARVSFRYGGDRATRTAVFTSSVLHGADANVHATRAEALEALLRYRSEHREV